MTFLQFVAVLHLCHLLTVASGNEGTSLVLPEAGYCGEQISGTCTATDSTRLTLDISGLGSHTFTPTSEKSIEIEGVSLNLMELTPTQDKFSFMVSISFTMRESLTISCVNDIVDETHQVLLKSKACLSQIKYIPSSGSILWERPQCFGWEETVVYTITVATEDSVIERSTDQTDYVFLDSVKGVVNVSVSAENSCGETTQLDHQLVNTDTPARGGLAGGDDTSNDSGPGELEKSLLIFFLLGLAPPILLLMIVFIFAISRKVLTEKN